jgi:hypothetical protein
MGTMTHYMDKLAGIFEILMAGRITKTLLVMIFVLFAFIIAHLLVNMIMHSIDEEEGQEGDI